MSKEDKKTDKLSQIQAIERKLQLMEKKNEDELKINDTVAAKASVISQYQQNKVLPVTNGSSSYKLNHSHKRNNRHHKPYVNSRLKR